MKATTGKCQHVLRVSDKSRGKLESVLVSFLGNLYQPAITLIAILERHFFEDLWIDRALMHVTAGKIGWTFQGV